MPEARRGAEKNDSAPRRAVARRRVARRGLAVARLLLGRLPVGLRVGAAARTRAGLPVGLLLGLLPVPQLRTVGLLWNRRLAVGRMPTSSARRRSEQRPKSIPMSGNDPNEATATTKKTIAPRALPLPPAVAARASIDSALTIAPARSQPLSAALKLNGSFSPRFSPTTSIVSIGISGTNMMCTKRQATWPMPSIASDLPKRRVP